mgnify:CR=1 FL=1|tara:strand:+ start:103 stop:1284 length:1182 start_codon:yes stop_codon:yes gene_type:complete
MSYFNHAFSKTFVVSDVATGAGVATSALTAGQAGLVSESNWQTVATGVALPTNSLLYFVQGSFYSSDTIGNNPGHGGYKESVKSKGINPKFINRLVKQDDVAAVQSTATLSVASDCVPCGSSLYVRMDVKGTPALRFLNHNAYAIGDSANVCCIDGQTYVDPAVALATASEMLLADPLIKPFVAERSGGAMDVTVAGSTTQYTIAEVLNGTYTPSTDPITDQVSAKANFIGAYVDTKFGDCSFDTRDFYGKDPVSIIPSLLDETGDPCNDCGVATSVTGKSAQTLGETVIRDLLLSENYRQSPYNQGNADSARIREIEMSDEILAAVDRTITYVSYYIQHTVPRYNNPSGVFDNDQYLYKIYVANGIAAEGQMDNLMADLATASGITLETFTV